MGGGSPKEGQNPTIFSVYLYGYILCNICLHQLSLKSKTTETTSPIANTQSVFLGDDDDATPCKTRWPDPTINRDYCLREAGLGTPPSSFIFNI